MEYYVNSPTTIEYNSVDEIALANVISSIMVGLFLTNISGGIGKYIGISSAMVSMGSKALILLSLIRCIPVYLYRVNGIVCCIFYFLIGFFVLQGIFFSENYQFLYAKSGFLDSTIMVFVITVLPAMITFAVIEDFDILMVQMERAGIVISVITMFALFRYGGRAFESYAMGFANAMVLPVIQLIVATLKVKEKRPKQIFYTVCICCDIFAVAVYGSRGAFLAILVFSTYFFMWKQIMKKDAISYFILVGIAFTGIYYKRILKVICKFALDMGFYSRTLVSLSSDNISDSGRKNLYEIVILEIQKHPFKIRGINADYNLLGSYCHNWFLELLYSFGIIIGGILCIVIIFFMIKSVKAGLNNQWSQMRIGLMFSFFPICLLSGSIWQSTWFWSWIVMCVRFL